MSKILNSNNDTLDRFDSLLLNCQGLTTEKIDILLSDHRNLKILCLTEIWQKNCSINSYFLHEFEPAANFCRSKFNHGGVGIWIKKGLNYKQINLNCYCVEKHFEICGINYKLNKTHKVLLLLCYRSPYVGDFTIFCEKISSVLDFLYKPQLKIILMGDFNIDPKRDFRKFTILENILATYSLRNIVNKPTRGRYILDHIHTNDISSTCCVIDNIISDHRSVLYKMLENRDTNIHHKQEFKRVFQNENINSFCEDLCKENWKTTFENTDLNTAFNNFYNELINYFNIHFPIKKFYVKKGKGWVNNETKLSSKKLKEMFQSKKHNPDLEQLYIQAKKQHCTLIKQTKRAYYQNLIINSDNQTKSAWHVINMLSNKTRRNNTFEIMIEGSLVDDPIIIANHFNNFFKESPYKVLNQIPRTRRKSKPQPSNSNSLFLEPFERNEFLTIIQTKLKPKFSSGYDNIPSYLLKKIIEIIAEPLLHLVNISFENGCFPDLLKINKIIPVYKSGSHELVENYRPIALSPVLAKVFEYCYLSRLNRFLNKYKLIDKNQFGFRSKLSTNDALHSFINKLLNCLENQENPVGIFCDLSKAFDCVNHRKLLEKLENHGIRGNALNWLASFLDNRRQFTALEYLNSHQKSTVFSELVNTDIGVPQGSVLSPVLFIIYTNDMFLNLEPECHITQYADDTSLLVSSNNNNTTFNKCNTNLNNLLTWLSDNQLFLNIKKTSFLQFHVRQKRNLPNPNLTLNNIDLNKTSKTKFLGLLIDENISWKDHCENLNLKLNSLCYLIRNLYTVLSRKQLLSIYHGLVESRLRYGISHWGASHHTSAVLICQKRILRTMAGLSQFDSCRPLFQKLNIMTVFSLYIYEICGYIYMNKNKYCTNNSLHNFNTRNKDNFHTTSYRLDINSNSTDCLGLKIYNKLPKNIKESKTVNEFRKKIKLYLHQFTLYSLNEYFNL